MLVGIAATLTSDGVLRPPVGGDAAFALAVLNVGATPVDVTPSVAAIQAEGNVGPLPLTTFICHTAPVTGQCVEGVATIQPGAFATFSVFVHAGGAVPLSPGTARIVATLNGRPLAEPPGAPYLSLTVAITTDPAP